jgi:hypothetical protein
MIQKLVKFSMEPPLPSSVNRKQYPNPNPRNFKILDSIAVGQYVVLDVQYPDCTNFEGRKVLVYWGISKELLQKQTTLDPHFCDEGHIAPIARFAPTKEGIEMAMEFCVMRADGEVE